MYHPRILPGPVIGVVFVERRPNPTHTTPRRPLRPLYGGWDVVLSTTPVEPALGVRSFRRSPRLIDTLRPGGQDRGVDT